MTAKTYTDAQIESMSQKLGGFLGHSISEGADMLRSLRAERQAVRSVVVSDEDVFYIDFEFDGHNGPLLSLAIVASSGRSVHIQTLNEATDPWVIENVMPLMHSHKATFDVMVFPNRVGDEIRRFLGGVKTPEIIADSPVDIARFCQALSTDAHGGWASADYPQMTFRVENVDCYPTTLDGAVQHNAWWDAMALREKLAQSHGVAGAVKVQDGPLSGKYRDVLIPFVASMEQELHANAGKGDRSGWLSIDRKTALLEIYYHLAKLQKATKNDDLAGIREYAADVANMSMILADVCGVIDAATQDKSS